VFGCTRHPLCAGLLFKKGARLTISEPFNTSAGGINDSEAAWLSSGFMEKSVICFGNGNNLAANYNSASYLLGIQKTAE
jgi:hypothetical protein